MSETRKLAAILVADIVGYSKLAGADEDRILARLRTLRSDLIDPTIAVHRGRVVKRTGDGSIVEFRSVVDAVSCAIEVQRGLIERNAGLPPERCIQFRIGVHVGDVVEENDGDLMGDVVNIAARLERLAEPGAVCLSEDAYRQVKGRLDLAVTDLGPLQLKNIAEPIRVYALQVGIPPKANSAAPKRGTALAPIAAGIVASLIVIAVAGWHLFNANRPAPAALNAETPTAAAPLSVVVLPFANLSGDPAQDYLADALTEGVTTAIARVSDKFFVISRNTAFTYKGRPIEAKALGKELGVRYVLEGSVQPNGARVRVNAQLIDAESGAHLWTEQFDTARADMLQMQDEIVAHLGRAMSVQLSEAEAARYRRMPVANPAAEDLALQCTAAAAKTGFIGKDADAAYRLCERALEADPKNVDALGVLSIKYWVPVTIGRSADPKGDLKRGDELVSQALALDPNYAYGHHFKAEILLFQARFKEAIAEEERALALDPTTVNAYEGLGQAHLGLGEFERSFEFFDKAIRLSQHDPTLPNWYRGKASAHFALRQYDQAIEWSHRTIAVNPTDQFAHKFLIASLALGGDETEANEALQRYLALRPAGLNTIAAWKAFNSYAVNERTDRRYLEYLDRQIEGLRKAGMPEG
jgi:adenylate cyclase